MYKSPLNLYAKRCTVFVSIYYYFLFLIIFKKSYLCQICGKKIKSISRLTKLFNTYKGHFYLKLLYKFQHKYHNKKNVLSQNWEDKSDLLGKKLIIAIANNISKMPTKNMF